MFKRSQLNLPTDPSKNIVAFSLDYDGMASFLFKEGVQGYKDKFCDSEVEGYSSAVHRAVDNYVSGAREILEEYLTQKSECADYVELFVGSKRQGRVLDNRMAQLNKNGLCFELFADLAERKGWYFNRLLLADIETDRGVLRPECLAPGTAMGVLKKNEFGQHKYLRDPFSDSLTGPQDERKMRILEHQIKSLVAKYPNDKITLIFMDDLEHILNGLQVTLKPYFDLHSSRRIIHNNIELQLMRYDPQSAWDKICDISEEEPNLTLFKEYIQNELVCIAQLTINEATHEANTSNAAITNLTFFDQPQVLMSSEGDVNDRLEIGNSK